MPDLHRVPENVVEISPAETIQLDGVTIESELVELKPGPLIAGVSVSGEPADFSRGIRQQVGECEAQGGFVEDIKLSTATFPGGGVHFTAIVMCRHPSAEQ